jgi:hypothetical protein
MRTMLICVTALALVCPIAAALPVHEQHHRSQEFVPIVWLEDVARPPTPSEIALRIALWGPASIAVALAALFLFRRLRRKPEYMKLLWLTIDDELPAVLGDLQRELGVKFQAGVVASILADCQLNQVDAKRYVLYESATLTVTGDVDEYEPGDIKIQVRRQ